jgi:tetratricopeptide (TPR) repeat protein
MRRQAPGAIAAAIGAAITTAGFVSNAAATVSDGDTFATSPAAPNADRPVAGAANEDSVKASRGTIIALLRAKDWPTAAAALDDHLALHPDDAVMHYNAACARAQLGALERAERALLDAIRAGFDDWTAIARDGDLAPLHARPMYRAILAARDAADGALASRRAAEWLARFDGSPAPYRHVVAAPLRLDFLTAMDDAALAAVMHEARVVFDLLAPLMLREAPARRVTVVLLEPAEAALALPTRFAHGRYAPGRRELVARADRPASLRHELVHVLHHDLMDAQRRTHAPWVIEGLAALFEDFRVEPDGRIVFLANARHGIARSVARSGRWTAWHEFIALDGESFDAEAHVHYAVARSMFEFIDDEASLACFIDAYMNGLDDDPTGAAALEAMFDVPLGDVEARWAEWVTAREFEAAPGEAIVSLPAPTAPTVASAPDAAAAGAHRSIAPLPGSDNANEADATAPAEPLHEATTAETVGAVADPVDATRETARQVYDEHRPTMIHEYPRAIGALRQAVALDPSFAAARYDLGLACAMIGDEAGAFEQREALLAIDWNLASLLTTLMESRSTWWLNAAGRSSRSHDRCGCMPAVERQAGHVRY